MQVNIGINGFGRIGRAALRIAAADPARFKLCGINLRNADLDYMSYLCRYDSVFGRFNGSVETAEDHLIINGERVRVFSCSDVSEIPWGECGAEYIVESTGVFNTTPKALGHLDHGAKKVILSAPAKDAETPTFVMGVNHKTYDPAYRVVSNASCTTNCLAPLVKVVHDTFGIEQALMSTIHSATSKQKPVDARAGRDYRTGRSLINNIIPSSTGAAKACSLVIPELKGKITGMSFRVPTNDVSVVDLTARLSTNTSYAAIMDALRAASEGEMAGIMTIISDDVVSADLKGEPHTCIVDEHAGIMLDENFVKLIAWYDNEWGYSSKLMDLAAYMAQVDAQ